MPVAGLKALLAAVAHDEGQHIVHGRHRLYKCPAGFWTIGYGRNLEANGISDTEARELLLSDVLAAQRDAASLVPTWFDLGPVRCNVVANMAFNMGREKLATFVKFLAALEAGDYESAADEMKASLWYLQVGTRAERLEHEMRTGMIA